MALLKHFMHWHLDPTSAFESGHWSATHRVFRSYMIALVTAQELRDALGNEAFFNPIVDQMIESILKPSFTLNSVVFWRKPPRMATFPPPGGPDTESRPRHRGGLVCDP